MGRKINKGRGRPTGGYWRPSWMGADPKQSLYEALERLAAPGRVRGTRPGPAPVAARRLFRCHPSRPGRLTPVRA